LAIETIKTIADEINEEVKVAYENVELVEPQEFTDENQ